jgi:hypothetical protein
MSVSGRASLFFVGLLVYQRKEPRPQGAGARAPLKGKCKKWGGGATQNGLRDTRDAPAKPVWGVFGGYSSDALSQQGCATEADAPMIGTSSPSDLFGELQCAVRVDYQTWNCQQVADEAGLLKDALAVASEQRAGDTAAHLRAETEAVHTARTLKKCNA